MKGDRADKRSDGVLTCVQKLLEEGRKEEKVMACT